MFGAILSFAAVVLAIVLIVTRAGNRVGDVGSRSEQEYNVEEGSDTRHKSSAADIKFIAGRSLTRENGEQGGCLRAEKKM